MIHDLSEMGFENDLIIRAVHQFGGNIENCLTWLFSTQDDNRSSGSAANANRSVNVFDSNSFSAAMSNDMNRDDIEMNTIQQVENREAHSNQQYEQSKAKFIAMHHLSKEKEEECLNENHLEVEYGEQFFKPEVYLHLQSVMRIEQIFQ